MCSADRIHPAAHNIHSREALGASAETNCGPYGTQGRHAGCLKQRVRPFELVAYICVRQKEGLAPFSSRWFCIVTQG